MTAEIAILNRSAVALAADSVVTLIGPLGAKTFDTAEKIFELLRHQPVGLMIYNNPLFMNVPFEIIARQFRAKNIKLTVTGLMQVWPHFKSHLVEMKHAHPDDETTHLQALVATEMRELQTERLAWLIDEGGRKRRRGLTKLDGHLQGFADARRKMAETKPLEGYLEGRTFEEFQKKYGSVISEAFPRALPDYPVKPQLEESIQRLMFALIKSDIRTKAFTGLVFAGFGEADLFGSLQNELDGIYFDEMRIVKNDIVDIDRFTRTTSAVVPFAQTQMPQRFIYGIDAQFEAQLDELMRTLTNDTLDSLPMDIPEEIKEKSRESAAANLTKSLEQFKNRAMTEIEHVVDHLSKSELAEVAHSLVEISWLKRRYSHDTESVGGPIDVAILTKNEGFIWVRRKHYFDSSLNPAYAKRLGAGERT